MTKVKNSSKINLLPTPGYILIEPTESETKTAGGIYLPDNAGIEKPQRGKVVAVGEEEILNDGGKRKSPVKIGEVAIYKKWGGNEIKENGKEYLLVKFEDILAIVK
jgi:chaperonin GroES